MLTDDTPAQFTILRLSNGKDESDYHPWDTLYGDDASTGSIQAAFLVQSWACDPCRSERGIAMARHFLRRWPEGPQAEDGDVSAMQAYHFALGVAARELAMEALPLDKMNIVDRCLLIRQMTERLKDFKTDSIHAYLLRMRIAAAASFIQSDHQRSRAPWPHGDS